MERDDLQKAVSEKARSLFERVRATTPSVFNRAWWSGKVMDWCMQNEEFKVEMFRFVDVLPYLNTSASVARHLQEYFCRPGQDFPMALQWGINRLSPESMAARIAAKGVRSNIVTMAKQFITGSTPEDALPNIKRIRKEGLAFTLDLLGEATLSEPEADQYRERYLELLGTLVKKQDRWAALGDGQPDLDWGFSPRVNISIKPSAFNARMHPANFQGSIDQCKKRIRPVLSAARKAGAFINLDIEQYAFKDMTLELFKQLMEEDEFKDYPHAGVVLQAYLKDTNRDARQMIAWARRRKTPVTVRLVKGAYWDYETVLARQEGWEIPVYTDKNETDANFEEVARLILDNHDAVRLACASHNLRSIALVLEYSTLLGIPKNQVEYQVLFGMAEPVKMALLDEKVPLRVYATVGELIPGMAYLVRRLLENTANESFLRQSYAEGQSIEVLAEDPRRRIPEPNGAPPVETGLVSFANEPHLNWALPEPRKEFPLALARVEENLGRAYPLYLNGEWVETRKKLDSTNPARPGQVVGAICQAGKKEVTQALEAAKAAFPAWRDTDPDQRAGYLMRAADLARQKKNELARLAGPGGGQALDRGRRRRNRGHRLFGLLRPGNDAPGPAPKTPLPPPAR